MMDGTKRGYTPVRKCWAVLLVCAATIGWGWNNTQAALLDRIFGGVEESLAERVAKKGEKLTVGNFYTPERPDSHGPIGMMGDHTHNKGEVMFSYRYMYMDMDGLKDGTNDVSTSQALSPNGYGFLVTPTDMQMEMHMFSGMWGVNDTVTLMVMVPYLRNSMDHVTRMGAKFQTKSNGIGDVRVTSLVRLYAVEAPSIGAHRFHFNLGIGIPTGDIEKTDRTPLGHIRLPYPMQLGSGTPDLFPGFTYGGMKGNASWGFQAMGTLRIGRNDERYSQGDAYQLTTHGAYRWSDWASTSVRFNWQQCYNYDGLDSNITRPNIIVATADPDRRDGQRLDFLAGVNVLFPEWMDLENRISLEGGLPVYQYIDGPNLETDWIFTLGWQLIY